MFVGRQAFDPWLIIRQIAVLQLAFYAGLTVLQLAFVGAHSNHFVCCCACTGLPPSRSRPAYCLHSCCELSAHARSPALPICHRFVLHACWQVLCTIIAACFIYTVPASQLPCRAVSRHLCPILPALRSARQHADAAARRHLPRLCHQLWSLCARDQGCRGTREEVLGFRGDHLHFAFWGGLWLRGISLAVVLVGGHAELRHSHSLAI